MDTIKLVALEEFEWDDALLNLSEIQLLNRIRDISLHKEGAYYLYGVGTTKERLTGDFEENNERYFETYSKCGKLLSKLYYELGQRLENWY